MGLKITSIARLPQTTERAFFIYFLDYGWEEPLSWAMYDNFDKLASIAADHKALVLAGFNRQEFANEILSWHHINGEDAGDILPAIMITDDHPSHFRDRDFHDPHRHDGKAWPPRLILIPLRRHCSTPTDVSNLLERLASDIRSGNKLSDFSISRMLERQSGRLSDALILEPNFSGIGVDLKVLGRFLMGRMRS